MMRTVSWGDGLIVEAFKMPGGLKAAVDAITAEVGTSVGSRNTFAKLLRVPDPSSLSERDQWRAWLLLTTFQQHPGDWGVCDDVVPPAIDIDRLRAALWCARRDSNPQPSDLERHAARPAVYLVGAA